MGRLEKMSWPRVASGRTKGVGLNESGPTRRRKGESMSASPAVTLPVHGKSGTASDGFWDTPLNDLLQQLQATPAGLTSVEAKRRLDLYGPNSLERESRFGVLLSFVRSFANPLILILMAASAISLTVGDPVGGLIIIAMVLLSASQLLYGVPGPACRRGDSKAGCFNCGRCARRPGAGTNDR